MSLSLKITPKEVHRLPIPETGKVAEIAERTRLANNLAFEVKTHWEEMPPKLREALMEIAYASPSDMPPMSLSKRVRVFFYSLRMSRVFRKEPEVIRDFLNAISNLSEAVLDAIEREDSEHQEAVAEAVEEALSDTNRRTMSAEEAREWNQQIFDKAFE